jgi:hypothetical protein
VKQVFGVKVLSFVFFTQQAVTQKLRLQNEYGVAKTKYDNGFCPTQVLTFWKWYIAAMLVKHLLQII